MKIIRQKLFNEKEKKDHTIRNAGLIAGEL